MVFCNIGKMPWSFFETPTLAAGISGGFWEAGAFLGWPLRYSWLAFHVRGI
jgi:hypothetical protein